LLEPLGIKASRHHSPQIFLSLIFYIIYLIGRFPASLSPPPGKKNKEDKGAARRSLAKTVA
jgi:Na+-transporting methylmalonyl-CoA/oxaloacetate decarboxylase gamma subunit